MSQPGEEQKLTFIYPKKQNEFSISFKSMTLNNHQFNIAGIFSSFAKFFTSRLMNPFRPATTTTTTTEAPFGFGDDVSGDALSDSADPDFSDSGSLSDNGDSSSTPENDEFSSSDGYAVDINNLSAPDASSGTNGDVYLPPGEPASVSTYLSPVGPSVGSSYLPPSRSPSPNKRYLPST